MNDTIYKILVVSGAVTIIACVLALIYGGFYILKEFIVNLHWKYKYKHRFDKSPTAKCYCKDCELHHDSGKCDLPGMGRYTPDDGYCYEASPLNKEGK